MNCSCVEFNDLPDEILMIIFKKIDNVDLLHCLHDMGQRINNILRDSTFTTRLTFVKWLSHRFVNRFCDTMMLHRFCLQILPELHDKVKWLDLDATSAEHVLRAAHYPDLDTLGLYNIDEESAQYLFTHGVLSSGVLKDQILTLFINIIKNDNDVPYEEAVLSATNIFEHTFLVFNNLTDLTFCESSYKDRLPLRFDQPPRLFRSSTLSKLNVQVHSFDDCLCLLDGRLNQLHTLHVDVMFLKRSSRIHNQDDLPTLRCFSLSCYYECYYYDEVIPPLLHRMSNLEELDLYVVSHIKERFIDGNHLKKTILCRLPRLNRFSFYIRSIMYIGKEWNVPSTEDIQCTFTDFPSNEIVSYVDYFREEKVGRCHVYSYPCCTPHYGDITNHFPGGIFRYVRVVSMRDEHPFEHEFFLRISQSFPLMEELTVTNSKAQNRKHGHESKDDNRISTVIEYSLLHELDLVNAHDDYIEEFLCHTKTSFPNHILLYVQFQSLQRVTQNFTRVATRMNCTKINELELSGGSLYFDSLQEYFPFARLNDSMVPPP